MILQYVELLLQDVKDHKSYFPNEFMYHHGALTRESLDPDKIQEIIITGNLKEVHRPVHTLVMDTYSEMAHHYLNSKDNSKDNHKEATRKTMLFTTL